MQFRILFGAVGVALLTSGCVSPRGGTRGEVLPGQEAQRKVTLRAAVNALPACVTRKTVSALGGA